MISVVSRVRRGRALRGVCGEVAEGSKRLKTLLGAPPTRGGSTVLQPNSAARRRCASRSDSSCREEKREVKVRKWPSHGWTEKVGRRLCCVRIGWRADL